MSEANGTSAPEVQFRLTSNTLHYPRVSWTHMAPDTRWRLPRLRRRFGDWECEIALTCQRRVMGRDRRWWRAVRRAIGALFVADAVFAARPHFADPQGKVEVVS